MMNRLTVTFPVLLTALWLTLAGPVSADASDEHARLTAVEAKSDLGQTRLALDFNRIPAWDLRTLGQKLEIRLKNTTAVSAIGSLPEDEHIVKTFIARDHHDLVVSVLLRRIPSTAVATPNMRTHRLSIDIRWTEGDTVRPAIVFDLPGVPNFRRIGQELKATGRYQSPWQGRWQDFLTASHTPFVILPAPALSLPLLPPPDSLRAELRTAWLAGDWDALIHADATDLNEAELLASAEALTRRSRYREATERLLVLEKRSETLSEKMRARLVYLKAVLLSLTNRPFEARAHLDAQPFWPDEWNEAVWILQIEANLAANDGNRALDLLTGREPTLPALTTVARRRRADALAMTHHYEQAYAIYQDMGVPEPASPMSLALYAITAHQTGRPEQARHAFARLAKSERLDESSKLLARLAGLTLNRTRDEVIEHFDELQDIRWQQPESEASLRALMRLTDIMAPAKNQLTWQQQLQAYDTIAQKADNLDLRMEAAIKVAVMQHLAGRDREAVKRLEQLLRRTHRGLLRNDAGALLSEILPNAINAYLGDGQPLKALALVERHRDRLQQQHISWDFLVRIAETFTELELHRRANRIFLFLYDRAKNPTHKGEAALAIAQNFAALGLWEEALNYADRAAGHFQLEQNRNRAYPLQLQARIKALGDDKAAGWLDKHPVPETAPALSLAAEFCWKLGRFDQVARLLEIKDSLSDLSTEDRLRLAEAAYRSNHLDLAQSHFRQLAQNDRFSAQARFRLAQILETRKQKDKAAALYRELAEQTGSGGRVWQALAQDRLKELTL